MKIVETVLSRLRDLLIRRSGGLDLTRLDRIPAHLTWTLERDVLAPNATLAGVRDEEPVRRVANLLGVEVWLVTGDAEVREVLGAGREVYSNDIRHLLGSGSLAEQGIGGLGFTDPPDHTRLRRLLTPEFTMRRLARLTPLIHDIVEEQLDEIAVALAHGRADLVDLFAEPVPFRVICDLLGLPAERREYFADVAAARFDVTHGGAGAFSAAQEALDFLVEEVRRQRITPGPGLIGQIIRDHGDDVDDLELAGLADGVFTGGMETSTSMLALGAAMLLERPDLWHRMATDADVVAPAVEELLRLISPVQFCFPRFVRAETQVGVHRIPKGAVIVCQLPAANRDRRTGLGEGLDLDAATGSHLAFGHGFHRCVGAELGRMELRAALPALARRFPDLALAVPLEDLRFRATSIVYGVEEVPVALGARPLASAGEGRDAQSV